MGVSPELAPCRRDPLCRPEAATAAAKASAATSTAPYQEGKLGSGLGGVDKPIEQIEEMEGDRWMEARTGRRRGGGGAKKTAKNPIPTASKSTSAHTTPTSDTGPPAPMTHPTRYR